MWLAITNNYITCTWHTSLCAGTYRDKFEFWMQEMTEGQKHLSDLDLEADVAEINVLVSEGIDQETCVTSRRGYLAQLPLNTRSRSSLLIFQFLLALSFHFLPHLLSLNDFNWTFSIQTLIGIFINFLKRANS